MATHDAALDAAGLATRIHRAPLLLPYLQYQIVTARENMRRRSAGEKMRPTATFPLFSKANLAQAQGIANNNAWLRERAIAQRESLGWVSAYLLTSAVPEIAGHDKHGARLSPVQWHARSAARVAAASGWFWVPPLATAIGLVEFGPDRLRPRNSNELFCRAADLLASSIDAISQDPEWREQLAANDSLVARARAAAQSVTTIRSERRCAALDATPSVVRLVASTPRKNA